MTITTTREQRRQLARDNALLSVKLCKIVVDVLPGGPVEVWRSRDYMVQIYTETAPAFVRLSIHRTTLGSDQRWIDGIAWEDLQRLKAECGYGDFDAIGVYPNDRDVVNVANIRHLWVMQAPIQFAWRKS
ncbi:MAG: hypothetical protein H7255_16935 [Ramlibacter sp.]|nr:hypothetical protein [Ramlibacter sp.]